jgi:hypothetical protein
VQNEEDIMITLTIYVDAAAAARCGHSKAGKQKLFLSNGDVESLDERERDTLAHHLADQGGHMDGLIHWGDPLAQHAGAVGEASLEVLRVLLAKRRCHMLAQLAEIIVSLPSLDIAVRCWILLSRCNEVAVVVSPRTREASGVLQALDLVQITDLRQSYATITLLGRDLLAYFKTRNETKETVP